MTISDKTKLDKMSTALELTISLSNKLLTKYSNKKYPYKIYKKISVFNDKVRDVHYWLDEIKEDIEN